MINTNEIDKINSEIKKLGLELEGKIAKAKKEYNEKVLPLQKRLVDVTQAIFTEFADSNNPTNIKHKGKVLGVKK